MKILGYDYTVKNSDSIKELENYFGLHEAKDLKILIRDELCEQQKVSTVLHEVLEALNYYLQLKLEHDALMNLEAGLYQVLTENGVDLKPLAKDVL